MSKETAGTEQYLKWSRGLFIILQGVEDEPAWLHCKS